METGGDSSPFPSISDWDKPFTDQELEAIEAAFQSATSFSSSPTKRSHAPSCDEDGGSEDRPKARRRLPGSIAGLRQQTPFTGNCRRRDVQSESSPMLTSNSFSLSPCFRNRFYSLYRSSAKLMMRYPKMTFRRSHSKKREVGRSILGFDIEWRPTFRRGISPGKAAVMQICGDTSHCYVMHIIHSGIPLSLQSLLEDPTTVKVGVGIGNDAVKVFKDHNVSIKALEELSSLANQKLGGDPKNWSLASLTEMLICKELQKPAKIQLGNWEADVLSKEQLQYAATDAFASWYLHQVLNSLTDPADNKKKLFNKLSK
ncbi:hypothetical protein F0562_000054 [Nyssa sinensis]|uniref:3'-5' exonuclease n=1 Tax=Nyssa sinensis TaxID=561372 RepID=A0A5J5C2I2_9ASTE|nr:hypothetical protein F0562_000054 [Nyssa sinensis]